MPGLTLCGDLGEWVGDGDLLNCCPEDINEPPGDDFETRLRERVEGSWIDPQVGFCAEEDKVFFLPGSTSDGDASGSEDEGPIACVLPTRRTLSLPAVAASKPAVEDEVVYLDYTERMHAAAAVDDMVPAGSCERQGIGRYRRFTRQ